MSVTGRHTTGKSSSTAKANAMAGTGTGEDIARAARVAELRRLVASGRYKVEPQRLAARILSRALHQG
jgi:anti-sigma28 factor (negative regulator of flagellin synthesis)